MRNNNQWLVGFVILASVACGERALDDKQNEVAVPDAGGHIERPVDAGTNTALIVNTLTLPTSTRAYRSDYDGSGRQQNQLAAMLTLIDNSVPAWFQTNVETGIAPEGNFCLLRVLSSQLVMAFAITTGGSMSLGDGGTTVTTHGLSPAGMLVGTFEGMTFQTDPSQSTLTLRLVLVDGLPPIDIPLIAVTMTGTYDQAAATITNGELHGAIRNDVLRGQMFPELATAFTSVLAGGSSAPPSVVAGIAMLDVGCGDDHEGANDNQISLCEINEGIVGRSLLPDLDLYPDAATDPDTTQSFGTYDEYQVTPWDVTQPLTINLGKADSVSFGVGFTAIGETF